MGLTRMIALLMNYGEKWALAGKVEALKMAANVREVVANLATSCIEWTSILTEISRLYYIRELHE